MQLRPSLYLPVAATTSNRVRQMDRKIRYRSAEKGPHTAFYGEIVDAYIIEE